MDKKLIIDGHVFILNMENGLYYTKDDFEVDSDDWADKVRGYRVGGPMHENGMYSPKVIMTDNRYLEAFCDELRNNKYGFFEGFPCCDIFTSGYTEIVEMHYVEKDGDFV